MKIVLFIAMFFTASVCMAQTKIITQATISTVTNVVAPEEDDMQNMQIQGNGGGNMFRNFGDGETKSTTYLKGDMVKTVLKNDMGRTAIIRNNATKLTTTLIEIMGNKRAFYATDEDQEELRKKADSMMQERRKKDTNNKVRPVREKPVIEVGYSDETKKIAGYLCKKAYIVSTNFLGMSDTTIVWFTPDIKFAGFNSTGGTNSLGIMGNALGNMDGFDKIDGFVMQYEKNMPRKRRMSVEVTKIETDKEVKDKEFEIPKDFDVKPMKEMQNMLGGGRGGNFQMRLGE